jgi:hypothetical protein
VFSTILGQVLFSKALQSNCPLFQSAIKKWLQKEYSIKNGCGKSLPRNLSSGQNDISVEFSYGYNT